MKDKLFMVIFFIGIVGIIIFLYQKEQSPNKLETGTIEEALYCMDRYIDSVKYLPDFTSILESFNKYLNDENVILNDYGTAAVTSSIDSAVLFNKQMDYSCLIMVVKTLDGLRNDYASVYHGTKIENKWIISEGMSFVYRRKKDSLDNYVPYTLEYLSRETRLEFIEDGFFKNKKCEIDWEYVEKWRK